MQRALARMLSPTVVDNAIASWKRARLSRDVESLGYPTVSVIGKVVELGPDACAASRGRRPSSIHDDGISDADRVQNLVGQMPEKMRLVFEAYHLALIGGRNHRGEKHKRRAHMLGLPYATYKYQINAGWRFIAEWLQI